MKLTKRALEKAMTPYLERIGYHYLKDNMISLYSKKTTDGLYITIGLTISRLYEDKFTVDLFLARYVSFNFMSFDIPKDSSKRIGYLLTEEERLFFGGNNTFDHWWSLYNDAPQCKIIDLIQLVEPRITGDKNLVERIFLSKMEQYWLNVIEEIKAAYISGQYLQNVDYHPDKPIKNIPVEWCMAADLVIKQMKEPLNFSWVKTFAEYAYRKYIIDSIDENYM